MKKKKLLPVMTICTVVLMAICAVLFLTEDRTGPVITFENENITYRIGDSEEELLKDVRAVDEREGDVSDTIRVDQIIELEEEKQIIVTYVAKDKSNNITKGRRWVSLWN